MTYSLIIRPEAETDMSEARDWYEEQQTELGTEFMDAIDDVFERISKTPEFYVAEYKAIRRAVLHRFPYIVYYRIVGESVEVIAVHHGSRSPRSWRSRINHS